LHVICAAKTDVGLIRSGNEDNYLMVPERGVFVVADGMGGHAAGEVASEMAVQIISRDLGSFKGLNVDDAATRMTQSVKAANAAIFERTLSEHDKRGMGTTATTLVLHGSNRYMIGQVGDSRAYLLREGRFHQLTKDHSYVQEQVDLGYLTPEQARTHPYANVITRCVGASADVMPDIFSGTVRAGDVFLLASDGLTGMVEDDALQGILQSQGNPERWVDKMVAEANRRGGLDNITCIIVHVDEVEAPGPDSSTTTGESPAASRKTPSGGVSPAR
jgi:protein phosphatase